MSYSKFRVLLPFLLVALAPAQTIPNSNANDDTVLKQIIIFGRHSVRSTTTKAAQLATYAARPFPTFEVQAGYLTPHGQQAELLLGTYYRDYLRHEGLLSGNSRYDRMRSYFRANSIQRSNITASFLAQGLLPNVAVDIHSYALGTPDPVIDPILANVAAVDPARALLEVQGIYGSGASEPAALSSEYSLVRSLLFDYPNGTPQPPSTPAGLTDPTAAPIVFSASPGPLYTGGVILTGGLNDVLNASDPFVMEYADGMPLAQVGWGDLTMDGLSQQTRLVREVFSIVMQTPYLNRVQSSNAASHVLRTMEQAVIGDTVPGAFGNARSRVVAIISSDAYVFGLAGLMRAHWQLPGYQPDFCPPGGALVFELRQSRSTGEFVVRVFYTAQSFDQLRNLTPLTLDQPPETMQLLIPGGSTSDTNLDVRFDVFQRIMRRAIGSEYVQDPATEVPPGPLTGVPLK